MRSGIPTIGAGWLVAVVATEILLGGQWASAQVWPIRFEEAAVVAVAEAIIVDPHAQSLSAMDGGSGAKQLISQSDVLPYCGDGDGCRVTLVLFPGGGELPSLRAERHFFITSAGSGWKVFNGSVLENTGDLTDGSLEAVFFIGGLDGCELAEELTSIGSIERLFLVAESDPSGPPLSTECRLRLED